MERGWVPLPTLVATRGAQEAPGPEILPLDRGTPRVGKRGSPASLHALLSACQDTLQLAGGPLEGHRSSCSRSAVARRHSHRICGEGETEPACFWPSAPVPCGGWTVPPGVHSSPKSAHVPSGLSTGTQQQLSPSCRHPEPGDSREPGVSSKCPSACLGTAGD